MNRFVLCLCVILMSGCGLTKPWFSSKLGEAKINSQVSEQGAQGAYWKKKAADYQTDQSSSPEPPVQMYRGVVRNFSNQTVRCQIIGEDSGSIVVPPFGVMVRQFRSGWHGYKIYYGNESWPAYEGGFSIDDEQDDYLDIDGITRYDWGMPIPSR